VITRSGGSSQEDRLRNNRDFRTVRAQGRAWVDDLVVLYALPNGRETTRIGITASKKLGKAVVRNKVKRRLREAMKLYRPRIAGGWDLVFAARGRAAGTGWAGGLQRCFPSPLAGLLAKKRMEGGAAFRRWEASWNYEEYDTVLDKSLSTNSRTMGWTSLSFLPQLFPLYL